MNVTLTIPATDAEALTLFLAERAPLWNMHASDFGVENPHTVPERLAQAYARAVKKEHDGATTRPPTA